MARLGLAHLLVILVVLAVSNAYYHHKEFTDAATGVWDEAAPGATPCCFPVTWQGHAVHLIAASSSDGGRGRRGKPGATLSRSADDFYVDGANKRLAGNMVVSHQHHSRFPANFSWIFKVGANRSGDLYIFDRKSQKCQHRAFHNAIWKRQCIPANATLHGTFSLGPATGGLRVQSWSFGSGRRRRADDGDNHLFARPGVAFGASILVVPGATACIPVLLHEHGFIRRRGDQPRGTLFRQMVNDRDTSDDENYARESVDRRHPHPGPHPRPRPRPRPRPHGGVGFSTSAYFSNVYPRIVDPSVFIVPSYCTKKTSTLEYQVAPPAILKRFTTLM